MRHAAGVRGIWIDDNILMQDFVLILIAELRKYDSTLEYDHMYRIRHDLAIHPFVRELYNLGRNVGRDYVEASLNGGEVGVDPWQQALAKLESQSMLPYHEYAHTELITDGVFTETD